MMRITFVEAGEHEDETASTFPQDAVYSRSAASTTATSHVLINTTILTSFTHL